MDDLISMMERWLTEQVRLRNVQWFTNIEDSFTVMDAGYNKWTFTVKLEEDDS